MMKHIRTFSAAAAALAASAVLLAPALAQQGPPTGYSNNDLAGAQGGYRDNDGQFRDRDDNRDGDRSGWNGGRQPEYNWAVEQCSRAANQEVWRQNGFSAQYDGKAPRFYEARRSGWELHGRLRIHDRRGFSYVNAICDLNNGRGNVRISFQR
jgi:hypothetical protein